MSVCSSVPLLYKFLGKRREPEPRNHWIKGASFLLRYLLPRIASVAETRRPLLAVMQVGVCFCNCRDHEAIAEQPALRAALLG